MAEQHRKTVSPAGRNIVPGEAAGEHSLSGAVDELHKQHPQETISHHDDRGPYHYTSTHERHIPVIRDRDGRAKKPYSRISGRGHHGDHR